MLWKYCTQYASKFGKLSSDHRTGKGEFSFQSQRKAMPKDAQTTVQLDSSHRLAKQCSEFSTGETKKTVRNFILGGSKITADGDCSHEIKRHLLLGRKAMTNLDSILKSPDVVVPGTSVFSSSQTGVSRNF